MLLSVVDAAMLRAVLLLISAAARRPGSEDWINLTLFGSQQNLIMGEEYVVQVLVFDTLDKDCNTQNGLS